MGTCELSLDDAVRSIRNYAVDHGMTPQQAKDCFLAGVHASLIFGGGKVVESTGWQSVGTEGCGQRAVPGRGEPR
ncbi:hypothetical protein SAMN04487785_102412 [Dyella jiangningensis]|nr:hypothetical protein BDW41_102411 [Dyella sp. AtDHG13]SDJ55014.1 hypothetical protein SAMN04487785_102412 [Dyella jiangningensis]